MKLRWNILLWIGSLLVLLSVVLLLLGKLVFLQSFVRLEEQQSRQTLIRGIHAVEQKILFINRTASDWASWDDTYRFMADRNHSFLESNLVDSTFQSLGLNVLLLLDGRGQVVEGKAFDLERESALPPFNGLLRELRQRADFWSFSQPDRQLSGILNLPEGPLLMAAHPILNSEGEGPVRGCLFMGRFLDEEELRTLGQKVGLGFSFSHIEAGRNWVPWQDSADGQPEFQLRIADGKNLRARLLLRDVFGKPACVLAVGLPRAVYRQGLQTIRYFNFWALSAAWLAGLIIYLLWDRLLLSREKEHHSDQLFQHLFQQSADCFFLCDERGQFVAVNRQACEILGYPRGELLTLHWKDITEAWVYDLLTNPRRLAERTPLPLEVQFQKKGGAVFPGEISISRMQSEGQTYFFVLARDVSERRAVEEKLRDNKNRLDHLAYHDMLTDLPNRLRAIERLQQALQKTRQNEGKMAVLLFDVDRFKNINESLGHETGDEILVEMACRLQEIVRGTDFVARFGGDEFLVVLEEVGDQTDVETVAEKILATVAQPLFVKEQQFYLTGSIGISLFPRHGEDVHTLLKCADSAMYHAKDQGRNNYQFFVPELGGDISRRLYLETDLRQALERQEFALYFQPQFDFVNGRLQALEALLRWQHPQRGIVPPGEFIPLAEDTGLIVPIGEWVLRQACRHSRQWQEKGLAPVRVAVNISARQFRQAGFVDMVVQTLQDSTLAPEHLELEITESVVMQSPESALRMLTALREAGLQLAVDDFGTGYSSLIYLKRFPFSRLKIDQSFVRNLVDNASDEAIAAAIVALGRTLRLEVVAEGIETEKQIEVLRRLGCQLGQGFLLSRPMDAAETERFLRLQAKNKTQSPQP